MISHLSPEGLQVRYRRRLLTGGIASLVILGITPMFGNLIARSSFSPLAGIDHIGSLCLIALHFLLLPVYYLLQGMLVCGLLYALWDRGSAWFAMRRVLRVLPARIPNLESPFSIATHRAGLSRAQVRVVPDLANPAFTVGFLRPRVYLAASLATQLSLDELIAVLRHEAVHVTRRDPLRLSVLRFFACLLFWIPALRRLVEDVADESELEADRKAAGDAPLVLASALLALAHWKIPEIPALAHAVGFTRNDILHRRVRALAGDPVSARSRLSGGLAMAAMVSVTMTWGVGMVVAHPIPDSMPHRTHSLQTNWECLYARMTESDHVCPHQHTHSHTQMP